MLAAKFIAIANADLVRRPRVSITAFLTRVAFTVRVLRPDISIATCFVVVFALAKLVVRPKDVVSMRTAFSCRVAWTICIVSKELAF